MNQLASSGYLHVCSLWTKQQDIITIHHLAPDATRSNVSLHIWIMPHSVGCSRLVLQYYRAGTIQRTLRSKQ